jgi:hypothetical protein
MICHLAILTSWRFSPLSAFFRSPASSSLHGGAEVGAGEAYLPQVMVSKVVRRAHFDGRAQIDRDQKSG